MYSMIVITGNNIGYIVLIKTRLSFSVNQFVIADLYLRVHTYIFINYLVRKSS